MEWRIRIYAKTTYLKLVVCWASLLLSGTLPLRALWGVSCTLWSLWEGSWILWDLWEGSWILWDLWGVSWTLWDLWRVSWTLWALWGVSCAVFCVPLALPLPLFLFSGAGITSFSCWSTWTGTGLGLAGCCLTLVGESGLPACTGKCLNCPFTQNIRERRETFRSSFVVMSEKILFIIWVLFPHFWIDSNPLLIWCYSVIVLCDLDSAKDRLVMRAATTFWCCWYNSSCGAGVVPLLWL